MKPLHDGCEHEEELLYLRVQHYVHVPGCMLCEAPQERVGEQHAAERRTPKGCLLCSHMVAMRAPAWHV